MFETRSDYFTRNSSAWAFARDQSESGLMDRKFRVSDGFNYPVREFNTDIAGAKFAPRRYRRV
jgi:hypothetical protein